MNLLETFNTLDRLMEDSSYLAQFEEKDKLDAREKELNTRLKDWDHEAVDTARFTVKKAMARALETIPSYNDIRVIPILRNTLVDIAKAGAVVASKQNKNAILSALRSEEGLTFSVHNSHRTLVYRNVKVDSGDFNALRFNQDYKAYCLDLYYLIDFVDVDSYENDAEDPGSLSSNELRAFAASINTIISGEHWFVPITSSALTFENITIAAEEATDNKKLVNIVDNLKGKIFSLQSNFKDVATSSWMTLERLNSMITLSNEILNARMPELQKDFGTDIIYKVIFDNIESANAEDFRKSLLAFIKEATKYITSFKDYDELLVELSNTNNSIRNFKIRKPKTEKEKRAKRAFDTKQKVDAESIVDVDWYVLGWLAKHIKRLTFTCPAEDVAVWKSRLDSDNITNKKPKGFIDAWDYPELVTGSIILDTPAMSNSVVGAYMTSLIKKANTVKDPREKQIADLTDSSKQINSWKIVRDLVADYDFQLSPFKQEFDENGDPTSTKYKAVPQDITKIAPSTSDADAYKSFNDGYNA